MGLKEYTKELYNKTTDGYIQILKIEDDRVKSKNIRYNNISKIMEYEDLRDIFITPNTMFKPERRVTNIRQFRALFQDLDIQELGLSKSEVVYMVWELYYAGKIPMPTFIVDSGRGFHVYWKIVNAPYGAIITWQELQDYLYTQLKHLGADRRAIDGARVLRLPNTINSRSETKCELIESTLKLSKSIEYSMYDLREQYLNYKPKTKQLQMHQAKKVNNKVIYNKMFNSYSLHLARVEDLEILCKLRAYDVKGYRNMIIHCFAYWKGIYIRDNQELLNEVIELNNAFVEPLKESVIISIVKSVDKAIGKFIEYEQGIRNGEDKRVTKGMRDKAGYWYKNDTLIDRLGITQLEQKKLKTIIGTDEKYERNNERRKENRRNKNGLTDKQQELQDLKIQVLKLKGQGKSIRKIAEILGKSKGTIENILKKKSVLKNGSL